ncbi:MAG: hypothetical protein OEV25_15510, partial [Deltaproteobacteria bacterium]|nr:hypothetical protein [Deltaproteobacteria bacterium]
MICLCPARGASGCAVCVARPPRLARMAGRHAQLHGLATAIEAPCPAIAGLKRDYGTALAGAFS